MKILAALSFLFFVACGKPVHVYTPSAPAPANPEFIFASFSIKANSENETVIRLLELKKISGVLKSTESHFQGKNYLTIRQLAQSNTILSETTIEHPLLKSVEYTNETGALERKEVAVKETEFFIRMPLSTTANYLDVLETQNAVTTPRLRTTLTPH